MEPRAVAFIATNEPVETRAFYTDVLGLRFVDENPFSIVFDAFGTTLRIQKVDAPVVVPYTAFGLSVDRLEERIDALAEKGVSGVRYAHLEQDARGIWTAPGGARVFWFHDPTGNLLSFDQAPA